MAAEIAGFVSINRQEIASSGPKLAYDLFSVDLAEIDQQPMLCCEKGEDIHF